ncbi:unnamed protein product [Effrenium voratum]|nr:unnamed protein product [Effrenium voratum]
MFLGLREQLARHSGRIPARSISAQALGSRRQGLRSGQSFVGLEEAAVYFDGKEFSHECFSKGVFYADPTRLESAAKSVELTAENCQNRCQGTDGCAYFTFWLDGGCMLAPWKSTPEAAPVKYSNIISGPKYCEKNIKAAVETIAAAKAEPARTAVTWGAGGVEAAEAGLQAVTDDSTKAAEAVKDMVAPAPGVNGTSCAKYPACAAAGLDGECCPNTGKVSLDCCNGIVPATTTDITVHVTAGPEVAGKTGSVRLYLHDKALADVGATLVSETPLSMEDQTVTLKPDSGEVAATGMVEPSYYISVSGEVFAPPIFDVKPGQTVEVELKPREE